MKRSDVQRMLVEERHNVHNLLTGLDNDQWNAPSLCEDWSVQEVAAHLASVVGVTRSGLVGRNLRYGSGTDGANRRSTAAWVRKGRQVLVDSLDDPKKLGLGFFYPRWALCEAVVHHQDMARPLHLRQELPAERVRIALDVLAQLRFLTGASRASRAVSIEAVDLDWSHGKGPTVEGNAESILMALAGRTIDPDELAGEGVAVLLGT